MGYPNRILRTTLGPTLRDSNPVENPETDIGADALNALFWQVAGLNLALPTRASIIAAWNGTAFDIKHQAEAWNPKGDLPRPVLTRTGIGAYTYTVLPQYPDETGTSQNITLVGARVTAMKSLQSSLLAAVAASAWLSTASPRVVEVRLWRDATGSPEDAPFWLEVA